VNGIAAVLSGLVGQSVSDSFGPVAPFDTAVVVLVLGGALFMGTWAENFGNPELATAESMKRAIHQVYMDPCCELLK